MKKLIYIFYILPLLVFLSCEDNSVIEGYEEENVFFEEELCNDCLGYIISIDYLRFRDTFGSKARIIGHLRKGSRVELTGLKSSHTEQIVINGVAYNEPWVQIKTNHGKIGWIFQGGLDIIPNEISPYGDSLIKHRAVNVFGDELLEEILNISSNVRQAETALQFQVAFLESKEILKKSNKIARKELVSIGNEFPELNWMNRLFPLFSVNLSSNRYYYYLDFDYDKIAEFAKYTTGNEDDNFAFVREKTNHYFEDILLPVYLNLDSKGKKCLRLGDGSVFNTLKLINSEVSTNKIFVRELIDIKDEFLKEITKSKYKFCNSKSDVKEEILRIKRKNFSILSKSDIKKLNHIIK